MTESSTEPLDLRGYLRPLRSRWWIVVLIAVVAGGLTYGYYDRKSALYSASTTLLLQSESGLQNGLTPDGVVAEQAVIIGTRAIARLAADELGVPDGALPGVVAAQPSKGTNFVGLTATTPDPRSAVRLVNAYARVYIRYAGDESRQQVTDARRAAERRLSQVPEIPTNRMTRLQLEATIQSLGLQENASRSTVQQIEPAVSALTIRASPKRNAIFAFVLGGLLGLGIVYALEHLDRRVKRLEEVADLYDSPVLVAIPSAPKAAGAAPLPLSLQPPLTEAFRTLRTALQLHGVDADGRNIPPPRTIVVTSAIAGEGKSTVARSLALAYYEAGLRVALVDADLRRPTIAGNFGLDAVPGLAEVLQGAPLMDALRLVARQSGHASSHETSDELGDEVRREAVGAGAARPSRANLAFLTRIRQPPQDEAAVAALPGSDPQQTVLTYLSVLTSGKAPRDPAALLAGQPIDEVLRALEPRHDVVIVDTSPLLPVSDAIPLLAAVDGVLIVSRMGVTTRHAVMQLSALLARVPDVTVLGVVANDVRHEAGYGYGGYGYGEA